MITTEANKSNKMRMSKTKGHSNAEGEMSTHCSEEQKAKKKKGTLCDL